MGIHERGGGRGGAFEPQETQQRKAIRASLWLESPLAAELGEGAREDGAQEGFEGEVDQLGVLQWRVVAAVGNDDQARVGHLGVDGFGAGPRGHLVAGAGDDEGWALDAGEEVFGAVPIEVLHHFGVDAEIQLAEGGQSFAEELGVFVDDGQGSQDGDDIGVA